MKTSDGSKPYACVTHTGMFCGPCYENKRRRANHKGHLYYQSPKTLSLPFQGELMKRMAIQDKKPVKGKWVCPDVEFAKKFPTIAQYLSDCWYDDGESREVSSLTVKMADGVTLALSDPDLGQSCFTTAPTLSEAFQAMESALAGSLIKWHRWKKFKKG